MKKILMMLILVLFFLITAIPAFADSSINQKPEKVIENPEITDHKILFERAVNGISDLKNEDLAPKSKAHILNSEDGILKNIKVYSTTQLLKEEKFKDGRIDREYVTTTFGVIKESDLKNSGEFSIQGALEDDKWDPETYSVRAYSTIRWTNQNDSQGLKHITMAGQTISGGWSLLTGFSIKNKTVTIGQTGLSSWGGYLEQIAPYSIPDKDFTFSKKVSASWKPVFADSSSTVGCTQTCRIYRGTSTSYWTFSFSNNIY